MKGRNRKIVQSESIYSPVNKTCEYRNRCEVKDSHFFGHRAIVVGDSNWSFGSRSRNVSVTLLSIL
jgi:hypothetical protein